MRLGIGCGAIGVIRRQRRWREVTEKEGETEWGERNRYRHAETL